MVDGFRCCLCGVVNFGWGDKKQYGNNPQPVAEDGQCCDHCNATKVIPARIKNMIGAKS